VSCPALGTLQLPSGPVGGLLYSTLDSLPHCFPPSLRSCLSLPPESVRTGFLQASQSPPKRTVGLMTDLKTTRPNIGTGLLSMGLLIYPL
jgi:hypothetical protein